MACGSWPASLVFPHYRERDVSAPGIPVRFVECPAAKKAKRPSALDPITLLRKEINETSISDRLRRKTAQNSTSYAYT